MRSASQAPRQACSAAARRCAAPAARSPARTHEEVCVRQQLHVGEQVQRRGAALVVRQPIERVLHVRAHLVRLAPAEQRAAQALDRQGLRLAQQRLVVADDHARAVGHWLRGARSRRHERRRRPRRAAVLCLQT